MPANPIPEVFHDRRYGLLAETDFFNRHASPSAVVFALPDVSVTRQLQPAFPYFLHNLTASAADTSGFLHTSLSKIRGNPRYSSTRLVSPRISD
ncbi:MAG TPA: hypothetical protein VFE29_04325 [Terriglobia bacterium]|nr:hypothetical protein [Terriglobia bacterium]